MPRPKTDVLLQRLAIPDATLPGDLIDLAFACSHCTGGPTVLWGVVAPGDDASAIAEGSEVAERQIFLTGDARMNQIAEDALKAAGARMAPTDTAVDPHYVPRIDAASTSIREVFEQQEAAGVPATSFAVSIDGASVPKVWLYFVGSPFLATEFWKELIGE